MELDQLGVEGVKLLQRAQGMRALNDGLPRSLVIEPKWVGYMLEAQKRDHLGDGLASFFAGAALGQYLQWVNGLPEIDDSGWIPPNTP